MTNEPPSKVAKLENNVKSDAQRERETQGAIEKIDEIQSELDSLNDKASEEILQVSYSFLTNLVFQFRVWVFFLPPHMYFRDLAFSRNQD